MHPRWTVPLALSALVVPAALLGGPNLFASPAADLDPALPEASLPAPAPSIAVPVAAAAQATPVAETVPALNGVRAGESPFHFTTRADRAAVLAGTDGLVRVEVTIASDAPAGQGVRVPTDLVLVLDTSGSMSGQKVRDAQAAARELVSLLDAEDRLGVVDYDSTARVVQSLTPATDEARRRACAAIDALEANGSTQMQRGLDAGLGLFDRSPARQARVSRAILISDGLPDSQDGLDQRARLAARSEVPLTTVGIGEDYDHDLMARLADLGTGNFYRVEARVDLARVFADELSTARESVATRLAVGWSAAPGVRLVEASGYPVAMDGRTARFEVGSLYAGQTRRFWVTLAVDPTNPASRDLGTFTLDATEPSGDAVRLASAVGTVAVTGDRDTWLASLDRETWGRAVVEEEYNVLRDEVGRLVKAGRRDEALAAIDAYDARNGTLNSVVASESVTANMLDVLTLRQDVTAQFEGEDQSERQNSWSKSIQSMAWGTRRAGQAKGY